MLSGDINKRVWIDGDHVVREFTQPTRNAVLAEVKERRDNPGSVRDLGFGRAALTIPELDFMRLTRANPDLISPDAGIKTNAWKKFFRSSESRIYRNFSVI